ncbi:MAG: hypothetical protein EP332_07550 [Bacteroidetes bacterium]|nr:MAG: hypothetical protein EP332_07550 [Bacteroidota bacterium]
MKALILFSRPIRSGKTTELEKWCAQQTSIGGFLTPDRSDVRHLLCLRNRQYSAFELPENTAMSYTSIGRFRFANEAFQTGSEALLSDALFQDYIVVDEIGKLEMNQQKGWEPAFSQLLNLWRAGKVKGQIIAVVRDFLLADFIAHYQPDSYKVVHHLSAIK